MVHSRRQLALASMCLASLPLVAAACAAEIGGRPDNPPMVLGLSRTEISVGEAIEIVGGNFLTGIQGTTEVRLDGEYHTREGATYPIAMQFRPHGKTAIA